MNLRAEQLADRLGAALAPVYLVSGDEPLQQGEACDAIRAAARTQGFTERQVMHVEAGFDWKALLAEANALSLFAERKLIELRLPSGKPGSEGAKVIAAYLERPPEDTVLLIISGKLDKAAQKTQWFKAVDRAGVTVQVWPVEASELPGWIERRLRQRGLQPAPGAAALLAERVEGNLLAAAQEVEKLALSCAGGALDAEQVEAAVANSARFDAFGLVDAALLGDVPRVTRMLHGLQAEGVEPLALLWAVAREIRSLAAMAAQVEAGLPRERAMARVWGKRKTAVGAGLNRHNALRWQQMLRRAGRIDRIVKGAAAGNAWDELLQLTLLMAGVPLFKPGAAAAGGESASRSRPRLDR